MLLLFGKKLLQCILFKYRFCITYITSVCYYIKRNFRIVAMFAIIVLQYFVYNEYNLSLYQIPYAQPNRSLVTAIKPTAKVHFLRPPCNFMLYKNITSTKGIFFSTICHHTLFLYAKYQWYSIAPVMLLVLTAGN